MGGCLGLPQAVNALELDWGQFKQDKGVSGIKVERLAASFNRQNPEHSSGAVDTLGAQL